MSFDGKDYQVLYDNGHREEYRATEMARMVLPPELEQVHVGSRVAVLWDDEEYYEATVMQEVANETRNVRFISNTTTETESGSIFVTTSSGAYIESLSIVGEES